MPQGPRVCPPDPAPDLGTALDHGRLVERAARGVEPVEHRQQPGLGAGLALLAVLVPLGFLLLARLVAAWWG